MIKPDTHYNYKNIYNIHIINIHISMLQRYNTPPQTKSATAALSVQRMALIDSRVCGIA